MNATDELAMQGQLQLTLQDKDGNVRQTQTATNQVVLSGRDLVARLLLGEPLKPLTHMAVGTGAQAVTADDANLVGQVLELPFTNKTLVDLFSTANHEGVEKQKRKQVVLQAELGFAEANGETLTEAALFNADGIMYNRVIFDPVPKTADFTMIFIWNIIF